MQVGLGWLIVRSPEPAGPLLWYDGGTNGFRSFVPAPALASHRGNRVPSASGPGSLSLSLRRYR